MISSILRPTHQTDLVRLKIRSISDGIAARTCLSQKRRCGCTSDQAKKRSVIVSFAASFQSARGVSRNASRGAGIFGAVQQMLKDARDLTAKGKSQSPAYALVDSAEKPKQFNTQNNPLLIEHEQKPKLDLLWDHIEPVSIRMVQSG